MGYDIERQHGQRYGFIIIYSPHVSHFPCLNVSGAAARLSWKCSGLAPYAWMVCVCCVCVSQRPTSFPCVYHVVSVHANGNYISHNFWGAGCRCWPDFVLRPLRLVVFCAALRSCFVTAQMLIMSSIVGMECVLTQIAISEIALRFIFNWNPKQQHNIVLVRLDSLKRACRIHTMWQVLWDIFIESILLIQL